MRRLLKECYHLKHIEFKPEVLEFFTNEASQIRESEIYLNPQGYKQKITNGIGYDRNKVLNYNYENSMFVKTKIKHIKGHMPRNDQLVWF